MRRSIFAVFLIVTAFPGAGAVHAAPRRAAAASPAAADPWERLNRRGYAINRFLDKVLIRPAAMLYRALTPGPIGKGLHNVVTNLSEPLVFINDVLQLRLRRAASTLRSTRRRRSSPTWRTSATRLHTRGSTCGAAATARASRRNTCGGTAT